MAINPETLLEDSREEAIERERRTGSIGNGMKVWCRPYADDPEVVQQRDRVVCLVRPYEACKSCHHRLFTLFFDPERKKKMETPVACPRWEDNGQEKGLNPSHYSFVTESTCVDVRPFGYCTSCPSAQKLVQIGMDKGTPGWYGRYSRYRKEGLIDG